MPDTLQALLVLVLAVLPGALHTWAFEREVGNWGVGLADRVLRFVGATALYQVALAFPLYWLWGRLLDLTPDRSIAKFGNFIESGRPLPPWVWLAPICYVVIPLALGTFAGRSVHLRPRISRILVGKDPAPRAWDYLFGPGPHGVVRLRLKDDTWIGGLFSKKSYAAGYPDPQDLYLERTYAVRSDGIFAPGISDDGFDELGSGILVRWEEVKFLEMFPLRGDM